MYRNVNFHDDSIYIKWHRIIIHEYTIVVIFVYLKTTSLLKIEYSPLSNRPFTFWSNCSEMLDIVVDVGSTPKSVPGPWELQPSNQLVQRSWDDCSLSMVLSDESTVVFKHFRFSTFFDVSVRSWRILSVMRRTFWIRNAASLHLSVCSCWACLRSTFAPDSAGITEKKYNKLFINNCCLRWLFLDLYILWYMTAFKMLSNNCYRPMIHICTPSNNFTWLLAVCFLSLYIRSSAWDCTGNRLYGVISFSKISRLHIFNVQSEVDIWRQIF